MHQSDVIALGPAGWFDAGVTIAASRCGARGFADLEFVSESQARGILQDLARHATTPFGIKVGPESSAILPALLGCAGEKLGAVLLAGGDSARWSDCMQTLRQQGVEILWEAVRVAEALRGCELGVDALVLKGQEAGGRVGEEPTFILLQRWLRERGNHALPFYVQGGVGCHTATACMLAGARGVVLDNQLLLTRESPVSRELQQRLATADGSETLLVGESLGSPYRVYTRPGLASVQELLAEESRIAASKLDQTEKHEAWRQTIHRLALAGPEQGPWFLGQDIALAAPLAARSGTIASLIDHLLETGRENRKTARTLRPFAEGSPLAQQLGTRYPILQGPMTRVSDTAAFADAVAREGGLPFLALALLRQAETEKLLEETKSLLGEKSWGVGILGFMPAEIRNEQLAAIRKHQPPFAIIAGGRPDQARELEKEGIPTYLHVPSPGLLRMFLRDGARRFIFEGRECGGHVGPRSSFVLWESMIEVLLEHLGKDRRGEDITVVFAGGVHDALSAAMVATLAAPLAERGIALGVLMGTAYLFTEEAVAGGAIVPRFQKEALDCADTVLLQTAPGHAIRCVPTPFCKDFEDERQRLVASGRSAEEIAKTLEWMNIGRLRLASKGVDRAADATAGPKLVSVAEEEQFSRGMYMIGQVACLRDEVTTVAKLHDQVSRAGSDLLAEPELDLRPLGEGEPSLPPCDIAIVGMGCFYPGSQSPEEFWHNILEKRNVVTEVPASHWDWRLYYDPDPRARDRIISKWGGFLRDLPFNPLDYGITPNSLHSIEPLQLFLLEASRRALADAGYDWKDEGPRRTFEPGKIKRSFPRERTAAILGIGGGGSPLAVLYGFRTCLPLLNTVPGLNLDAETVMEKAKGMLPEWTEDSFPGILFNVAVGRIANRFNLGGPNYAIDAACGSSLAAVYACVRELEMGTSDMAIAMGADTVQTPYAYMAFSKTHALSAHGRCRPFDAEADGIVLSEGVGAVILKRLKDAVRDGDQIYAVIKGMGASSDGKDKGLTAPRAEGQLRALERAFRQAGVSPASVELVEAHGTGTVVGDQTEARALARVMEQAGAGPQSCAVGSVKSMIGHTKCAAGIAGLIKTAMALHRRTLPPTLVETPNPKGNFEDGPLYLNTEARPWIHGEGPRFAGVSAFGFGGTNFHAVLSEYEGNYKDNTPGLTLWPAELFVWSASDRDQLAESLKKCRQALQDGARPALADLALSAWRSAANKPANSPILTILASSLEELAERLTLALEPIQSGQATFTDPRGIYYAARPADQGGEVAVLFPGQGSQYPNMLASLALAFPEVRQTLDRADGVLAGALERPLGKFLYPGSAFSAEREKEHLERLTRSDVAQPAIGACSVALWKLLSKLGIEADMLAGHSYGEFVALHAAGALDEEDLFRLSHRRGAVIRSCAGEMAGGMLALDQEASQVEALLKGLDEVWLANSNSPRQTVVAGSESGLAALQERCKQAGVRCQRLPVACGFHSPLVAAASDPLAQAIRECTFRSPRQPVYSNTTARPHSDQPETIASQLVEHLTSAVRFREQVEAMHASGARIFIEVGPQGILTGLVRQILQDKPHLAVASDSKSRPGVVPFLQLLGQLLVHGVKVRCERLFEGRVGRTFDLSQLSATTGKEVLPPTTWMVNSVRNRPLEAQEPHLLGQTRTTTRSETAKASPTPAPAVTPQQSVSATPPPSTHDVRSGVSRMVSVTPATSTSGLNGDQHSSNGHSQGKVAPASVGPAHDDASQVMLRFQDLMARFLDTQKSVMTTYLTGTAQGTTAPLAPLPEIPRRAVEMPRATVVQVSTPTAPPKGTPTPTPVVAAPEAKAPVEKTPEAKPATREASAKFVPDRAWITNQLQDLISKRTGYPRDMLSLDIDLEADLGIDSIKRVEILAEMAQALGGGEEGLPAGLEMEKLTAIGTLRGIIDYLEAGFSKSNSNGKKAESSRAKKTGTASAPGVATNGDGPVIQRAVAALVECPLLARPSSLLGSGVVLLSDDGQGIARHIAGRLADLGKASLILPGSGKEGEAKGMDLTDPQAVTAILNQAREQFGSIDGFLHLMPLQPLGEQSWDVRAKRDTRSLYLLARALEDDLRAAGKKGHAFFMAATNLGGAFGFGSDSLPGNYQPGQGGIAGFLKCLGQEWPEVSVRAVDFDSTQESLPDIADRMLVEMSIAEGAFEVGYHRGKRLTWAPRAVTIDKSGTPVDLLQPGDPVLITGGARGITAEIAIELSRRYRPTLILLGRSPLPEEAEEENTASLKSPAEIKAALIARMEREGRPPAPSQIEAAFNRLMQNREIRDNLRRMREAGATVHYHSVDVRDASAFGQLLDQIQSKHGGLVGVIHGAGVIEDRLVRSKTPESFDRVFETKVVSARVLAEKLNRDRLKFLVLFASLASRYGNKGQADYAAANEVLAKLAHQLDRQWTARVMAIAWGPWSQVGMVADLEKHLVQRGLRLISPQEGPGLLIDELVHGKKGDREIVLAGGAEAIVQPGRREAMTAQPAAGK